MIASRPVLSTMFFAKFFSVTGLALSLGCGGRSAVIQPAVDGGSIEIDLTQCTELCDEVLSICGDAVSFGATACVETCAEERPFDDCVLDCDSGCGCVEHCYLGDVLSCSGFCKWLRVEECTDLDTESCQASCNFDPQFAPCVDACSIRDCACLDSCVQR